MTSPVGIVGPTQGAPQQKAASVVASSAPAQETAAAKQFNGRDPNAPISPRIIVDPLAGVITQFLSTTGELQSQIPSAAVVAYLRAGLTNEGFAKPAPDGHDNSPKAHNDQAHTGTGILA